MDSNIYMTSYNIIMEFKVGSNPTYEALII